MWKIGEVGWFSRSGGNGVEDDDAIGKVNAGGGVAALSGWG